EMLVKRSSIGATRRSCQSERVVDVDDSPPSPSWASRTAASRAVGAGPAAHPPGVTAQPKASERDALIVDQAIDWYLPSRTTSIARDASSARPTPASTSAWPECACPNRSVDMGFRRE